MKQIIFFAALTALLCCNRAKEEKKCINPAKIDPEAVCTREYKPVCGCNGKTYGNLCEAEKAGLTSWTEGECEGENAQ